MARKVSPVLKYAIAGVIVLGIFVFMFRQTAAVFQPKARGQNEIRLFRGRSNYNGTFNQNVPWSYLSGNISQQKIQNQANRLRGQTF
jgi:hypothetical protein